MNVNFNDLKEIYGEEILEIINNNMDIIESNINTMKELGFTDVEGIFERSVNSFLYFPKSFKEKMDDLIQEVGSNYVEIIENDVSYMENL